MKRSFVAGLFVMLSVVAAQAYDYWLPITGSVNNFRSDVRIFNPSTTASVDVTAYFLPAGNVRNFPQSPAAITIGKREMKVYDDVVASLFNGSGLGAILLLSDTPLVLTARIYADTPGGTLGQFEPGLELSQGLITGVLIQLKSNANFRTNIGLANTVNAPVDVTFRLWDRSGQPIGTPRVLSVQNFGVISPINIAGGLFTDIPAGTDLSDCWVSFASSDGAQFVYASVIDNRTTDPTYIAPAYDPRP